MKLPIEIWEWIGQQLDIKSYHSLRQSNRYCGLGLIPLLSFINYKDAIEKYNLKNLKKVQCRTNTHLKDLILEKDIEFCRLFSQYPKTDLITFLKSQKWEFITIDFEYLKLLLSTTEAKSLIDDELLRYCCEHSPEAVEFILTFDSVNPDHVILDVLESSMDVIELLLEDDRVQNLNEILGSAVELNNIELVARLLQDHRCDPCANDQYPLSMACMLGLRDIAELLLIDGRSDPSIQDQMCIRTACDRGYDDIVELLLRDGRVDPSIRNQECLVNAVKFGHAKVVLLLLRDERINPFLMDQQILREAVYRGHNDVIQILKDKRVTIPTDDSIPIFKVM